MDARGERRARVLRAGLALAAAALAVAGILVATEGSRFPALADTAASGPVVTLAPAASTCSPAGPYRSPAPDSVGLPAGISTCAIGPLTLTTPGAVLDGWEIRGGVIVDAPDVVVRRSRITGDGSTAAGVTTTANGSVRIEDTTITGMFTEAAVTGDRWSGERLEIVAVHGDGAILGRGARLRASVIRDLTVPAGQDPASQDPAGQVAMDQGSAAPARTGGGVRAVVVRGPGDVLVEDNRIELGTTPGTALLLDLAADSGWAGAAGFLASAPSAAGSAAGSTAAVMVRGNLLGGGRVTVEQVGDTGPEVWLVANRFQRDATEAPLWVARSVVREDNSYVDGGRLPDR